MTGDAGRGAKLEIEIYGEERSRLYGIRGPGGFLGVRGMLNRSNRERWGSAQNPSRFQMFGERRSRGNPSLTGYLQSLKIFSFFFRGMNDLVQTARDCCLRKPDRVIISFGDKTQILEDSRINIRAPRSLRRRKILVKKG